MEIPHALMRDAEENVFLGIDDENDDDVFVSALSISNPDLEETKRTPSFLRLSLELFEVLLVEEDAAILHKLEALFLHDDDKANMIENFAMFFCCFYAKKKNIKRDLRFILSF